MGSPLATWGSTTVMDTELLGSCDSPPHLSRSCRLGFPCRWTQKRGEWGWGRGYILQLSFGLGRNWPKCCCYSVRLPKPGLWESLSPSLRVSEPLGKFFSSTCVGWAGARSWGLGCEEERGADRPGGQALDASSPCLRGYTGLGHKRPFYVEIILSVPVLSSQADCKCLHCPGSVSYTFWSPS